MTSQLGEAATRRMRFRPAEVNAVWDVEFAERKIC